MSMYSIGSNPYTSPEFAPASPLDAQQPSAGLGAYGSSLGYGGDGITNLWPTPATAATQTIGFAPIFGGGSGAPSGAAENGGAWNAIGALLNQFTSLFQNTIASIGNTIASLGGGTPAAAGGAPIGYGSAPGYGSPSEAQFGNATFHSVGDPHDAFSGTTASGTSLNASWDDKHSHGDLIDSDSFAGGLRVSTVTTPPIDANGTRYNESATIATQDGRTQITYNRDGSYYVSSGGQNVPLVAGQATSLGNGETVTLNSDGSLTMNDANSSGGNVSITLAKSDGGKGVNVTGSSNNIDLGGYLTRAATWSQSSPPSQPQAPIAPPPAEPVSPLPILPFQAGPADPQGAGSSPAATAPDFIVSPEEPIVDAPIVAPQAVFANLPAVPPAQNPATTPAVVASANGTGGSTSPLARFDWLQNARA